MGLGDEIKDLTQPKIPLRSMTGRQGELYINVFDLWKLYCEFVHVEGLDCNVIAYRMCVNYLTKMLLSNGELEELNE